MAELTVPRVDFSSLGDLPQVYRDSQVSANRQRTLAELGQGASPADVARKLFAAGDVQGGMMLSNLANNDRDFQFRQNEARIGHQQNDRQFGLQQQTANTAQVQKITDANGNEALVRIDRQGNATPVNTGQPQGSNNPFYTGKMNESQSKDGLYASRMIKSETILRHPDIEKAATSSQNRIGAAIGDKVPFGLGRGMMNENYQKYDQAKRDFINATLRRESGAVINPDEFVNADKQYFPLPGDTPDVIKQKRANREEAIRGIATGAGPSYRPPEELKGFGMQPRGQQPQGTPPQGPPVPGQTRVNGFLYKGGNPKDQSSWVKE